MNPSEPIVCKPTPWFLLRAALMLVMFTVFAVLFYIDGSTGYRKKNQNFYLHRAFQQASDDFSKQNAEGTLTAAAWERFAATQNVALPKDPFILPVDLKQPLAWPPVLRDYEQMKPLQWKQLWREYTKANGLAAEPPEEAYESRKIHEQWVVFWICCGLALAAGFFLIRTLGRSISADDEAITTQQGLRVPFSELKTLDLRKWQTKGLAFIGYGGPTGGGKIRLDGLTYGGFKKENHEPAERLMQKIRSHFSGEILEYATTPAPDPAIPPS
jgi:hypothetical protein